MARVTALAPANRWVILGFNSIREGEQGEIGAEGDEAGGESGTWGDTMSSVVPLQINLEREIYLPLVVDRVTSHRRSARWIPGNRRSLRRVGRVLLPSDDGFLRKFD